MSAAAVAYSWQQRRSNERRERAELLAGTLQRSGHEATSGFAAFGVGLSHWARLSSPPRATVHLNSSKIQGTWLSDNDFLHDLFISDLSVYGNLESWQLFRLIEDHPLRKLDLDSCLNTDGITFALQQKPLLTEVSFAFCDLTDDGFRRLPLEQLQSVSLTETNVTSAGLKELRRCLKLKLIRLRGDDFDDSVTGVLNELRQVKPDVRIFIDKRKQVRQVMLEEPPIPRGRVLREGRGRGRPVGRVENSQQAVEYWFEARSPDGGK